MNKVKLVSISMLSILAFMFILVSNALAIPIPPSLQIDIAGVNVFDGLLTPTEINGGTEYRVNVFIPPTGVSGNYSVMFDSTVYPDSSIDYAISAHNYSTATQSFNFVFSVPMTVLNPSSAASTFSYSLTDKKGNGISFLPIDVLPNDGYIQKSFVEDAGPLVTLGIDLDNDGFMAPSSIPPNKDQTYTSVEFESLWESVPAGTWNKVVIQTAFDLSGKDDYVTLNGTTQINPVPIPPTGVLLLFGLVGMIGIKKKFSLGNN